MGVSSNIWKKTLTTVSGNVEPILKDCDKLRAVLYMILFANFQHASAVVGDKMYIVGGNHNGRYLNDVQV